MAQAFQIQLMSMIVEGVFDRFPSCGWPASRAASPGCRRSCGASTRSGRALRREMPWTKRLPSAYVREHVRFTLQPIDGPDATPSGCCAAHRPARLRRAADVLDRLPALALRHARARRCRPACRTSLARKILAENARAFYRLGGWAMARLTTHRAPGAAVAGARVRSTATSTTRLPSDDGAAGRTCRLSGADRPRPSSYLPCRTGRRFHEPSGDSLLHRRRVPSPERARRPRPTPGRPRRLAPGSDLDFMREQLLDHWDIEYGVLCPLLGAGEQLNLEWGARCRRAINDWQVAEWLEPEPRLRASIVVPYEDGELAAAEIDRRGGDPRFVQVLCSVAHAASRSAGASTGRSTRRPSATSCRSASTSAAGAAGRSPASAGPRYYIEDHAGHGDSVPGAGDQPGLRGRLRALPDAQDRPDRGRLRLAAAADVAARPRLAAARERGAAPEAAALRVHPRALLADDPADGGAAPSRSRLPRAARRSSAWTTGSCSRPTTRTGTSTRPTRRSRPACRRSCARKIMARERAGALPVLSRGRMSERMP